MVSVGRWLVNVVTAALLFWLMNYVCYADHVTLLLPDASSSLLYGDDGLLHYTMTSISVMALPSVGSSDAYVTTTTIIITMSRHYGHMVVGLTSAAARHIMVVAADATLIAEHVQ